MSAGDFTVVTGCQAGGWIAETDVVEHVGGFRSQLKRVALNCNRAERSKINVVIAGSEQEVAANIAVNAVGADTARLTIAIVDERRRVEPLRGRCLPAAVRVQKRINTRDTVRAICTFAVIHIVVRSGYVDRGAAVESDDRRERPTVQHLTQNAIGTGEVGDVPSTRHDCDMSLVIVCRASFFP